MERLSEDAIDELLARCGVGVLSLFDGEFPYAIPMSFGYDGSEPIFAMQLGAGADSHKQRCLDASTKASFTVYDEPSPDTWQSVVMTGDVYEIDDEEETEKAFAALAANADFPADVRVWGVPLEDVELSLYGLDIRERTGQQFSIGTRNRE